VTSGLFSGLLGNVVAHPNGTVYGFGAGIIYRFNGTTGITDNEMGNSGITVFPNPSDGYFKVTSAILPISRIEVYNSSGSSVAFRLAPGVVDLTGAPKGIYLVKMYAGTDSYTRKIVVQ